MVYLDQGHWVRLLDTCDVYDGDIECVREGGLGMIVEFGANV